MTTTQIPFLVEAILILAAALFGFLIQRKGKPYGWVKLTFHLFFYVWLTVGFGYIASALFSTPASALLWTMMSVMTAALVVQLVTGITMWARKAAGKALPRVHITSLAVLLIADVLAFFLA